MIEILDSIEKARGKAKEEILKSHKDNDMLKQVCLMTYSKQITFGINKKTFPERIDGQNEIITLSDALLQLNQLYATRKLSGGNAITAMQCMLSGLSKGDAEVIRRVVFGDLNIGINTSTINKVWPKLVKEQPQMLSSPEDPKLIEKILKNGNAFAELKADGARGFGDVTDESVKFYTRSGNEHIGLDRIVRAIESMSVQGWVFDGEFVVRSSDELETAVDTDSDVMAMLMGEEVELSKSSKYQKTVFDRESGNGIMNKALKGTITQEEADRVVYQVWDIVPREVYYGDIPCPKDMTQEKRRQILLDFLSRCNDDCIQIIESTPVKTIDEVRAVYQGYVADGYEGIILKDGNSLWEDKRSKSFVKFKEKYPFDLRIVEAYPHDKDQNKVGGFTMVSECGTIKTNGGSGLTDTTHLKVYEGDSDWNLNQHLYEHHEDKAGKFIEVLIPIENRGDLDREKLMVMYKNGELDDMIVECEVNAPTTSKTRKKGDPKYSFFLPIIKKLRYDKSVANRYEDVFLTRE